MMAGILYYCTRNPMMGGVLANHRTDDCSARPGLIIMALMEESIVTVIITCKLHLVGLKKASHVVVSWR